MHDITPTESNSTMDILTVPGVARLSEAQHRVTAKMRPRRMPGPSSAGWA